MLAHLTLQEKGVDHNNHCEKATAFAGQCFKRRIMGVRRKISQKRLVLDGEAVILGVDGIADFNADCRSIALDHRVMRPHRTPSFSTQRRFRAS
jgi:hypothetical protein